ncbi:hypothetical protein REPUB_Repub20aG0048800 [Reevesia pubescens]
MLMLSICKHMASMIIPIEKLSKKKCLSSPMRISSLILIVLPRVVHLQSFVPSPFLSS